MGVFFMDIRGICALIVFIILLVCTAYVYFKAHPIKHKTTTRTVAATALFGALAAILYVVPIFNFSIPIFPSFLAIHIDEVPCFIAGFAYGPYAAIGAILVKTFVKLPMTTSMGVGELGDLVISIFFVVPCSYIYRKKRDLKGVAIGFGVGTLLQLLVALIMNVYVLMPFYANVMAGMDEESLLAVCQLAMPWITDIGWSYGLYAVLPFNLLKDAIVILLTFIVYRYTHRFIKAAKA